MAVGWLSLQTPKQNTHCTRTGHQNQIYIILSQCNPSKKVAEGNLSHVFDMSSRGGSHLKEVEKAFESYSLSFVLSNPREPDNPILYASENFYRTTGYTPKEVLGKNCRFLQGLHTSRQAVGEIRDAIREERETSTCLLNYKKDGTPFWNAFHLEPVKDEDGVTQFYIGIQCDVTGLFQSSMAGTGGEAMTREDAMHTVMMNAKDNEEVAKRLVEDVKRYSDMLHERSKESVAIDGSVPTPLLTGLSTIDQSFCLTDPHKSGNPMVYCSPGFLKMTQYSAKELLGKPCSMLQGEDSDPEQIEKIRTAIYSDPPKPVSAVVKNYRKNGEGFLNAMYIAPVNCSAGTIKYFCGVQTEIKEQDTGSAESSHSNDREGSHNPLLLLRQKGVIGAVRVAARGLSDNGLHRRPNDQKPSAPTT